MNSQYIFYPNLDLDLSKIKEIVRRRLNDKVLDMASHHRLVHTEPYLVELKNRYPFLSPVYNIYETGPGMNMPPHIDAKRNCTLNIPIENTEGTHTVFYEVENINDVTNIQERVYDVINSKMKEVYRFTLTQPVIMNTKVPHGVLGSIDKTRIIMSWSALPDVTYEELREKYSHD